MILRSSSRAARRSVTKIGVIPRSGRARKVRSIRVRVEASSPSDAVSNCMESSVLASTAVLFNLPFNPRKFDGLLLALGAPHPFDCRSVSLDPSDQPCRVDAEIPRGVLSDLVRAPLQQGRGAHEIPVLIVVVRRGDLDEALQEEAGLSVFLFPDILEDLVGLEEVLVVEEADAFLDRVEAVGCVASHRRDNQRARGESSFPRRLATGPAHRRERTSFGSRPACMPPVRARPWSPGGPASSP